MVDTALGFSYSGGVILSTGYPLFTSRLSCVLRRGKEFLLSQNDYSRVLLIVPEIKELLRERNREALRHLSRDYEPVEVAEIMDQFSLREKVLLFSLWDVDYAADVFEKISAEDRSQVLSAVDEQRRARILDELDPDDRADFFEGLPADTVKRFLSIMQHEEARDARQLLRYDPSTAGGRMTTEFAATAPSVNAKQTLTNLQKTAKNLETVYYVYVLNHQRRLLGVVSLRELIVANPKQRIRDIMHPNPVSIPVDMDQEAAAQEIAKYDFLALPVVDHQQTMQGIITVDDVIDVITEEDSEDMYKFGAAGEPARDYLSSNLFTMARNRITWLLILVATGLVTGFILQRFSFALESVVALTFYVPLLMGSAGNAGTQAAMVIVRGLATGEVHLGDVKPVLKKECLIGAALGIPLGLLGLFRALAVDRNPFLGMTVGLSMVLTIITATTLGAVLPLICRRLGIDPAVVSAPLITTVLDIASLLIYFRIAVFFLQLG